MIIPQLWTFSQIQQFSGYWWWWSITRKISDFTLTLIYPGIINVVVIIIGMRMMGYISRSFFSLSPFLYFKSLDSELLHKWMKAMHFTWTETICSSISVSMCGSMISITHHYSLFENLNASNCSKWPKINRTHIVIWNCVVFSPEQMKNKINIVDFFLESH